MYKDIAIGCVISISKKNQQQQQILCNIYVVVRNTFCWYTTWCKHRQRGITFSLQFILIHEVLVYIWIALVRVLTKFPIDFKLTRTLLFNSQVLSEATSKNPRFDVLSKYIGI